MIEKKELKYEGKAKKIYSTNDPEKLIIEYKNDASAFDGKKKGTIENKGIYNNKITNILFKLIEEQSGITNHLIEEISDNEIVAKNLDMIEVEVIVRNIVAGSLCRRTGLEEGYLLKEPIVEFYYKSDELGDPMINPYHVRALNLATNDELVIFENFGLKINKVLQKALLKIDIDLVDFKLEFGRFKNDIVLGDELSPDNLRLWDVTTKRKLDKDLFRFDLGDAASSYSEVLARLEKVFG